MQLEFLLELLNKGTLKRPRTAASKHRVAGIWEFVPVPGVQRELRQLLLEWLNADRKLDALTKYHVALSDALMCGQTMLSTTRTGRVQLAWFARGFNFKHADEKDVALTRFLELLVNPLSPLLGGPCARCDNFYVKKSDRQKTYCSKQCGGKQTAQTATQKRRRVEHLAKLEKARLSMLRLPSRRQARQDWKQWVYHDTRGSISVKWLTRAVNAGELISPV